MKQFKTNNTPAELPEYLKLFYFVALSTTPNQIFGNTLIIKCIVVFWVTCDSAITFHLLQIELEFNVV